MGGVDNNSIQSNQQKAKRVRQVQEEDVHLGGAVKNQLCRESPSLGNESGKERSDLTVGVSGGKNRGKNGGNAVADLVKDSQRFNQEVVLGNLLVLVEEKSSLLVLAR